MKMRKPEAYKAPLKSRVDIVKFLVGHENYYRSLSTCSPLAWDVKVYGADLSFEHLCEVYRKGGYYGSEDRWLDYPEFLEPARAEFAEVEDKLFNWAIDDAREGVKDTDSYRSLWSGKMLDVTYEFHGRSGGWLLMVAFEGTRLDRFARYEFEDWVKELDFPLLRDLYHLVVQNDHDFRREAVEAEIEYLAAFTFFENTCSDIPRPDKTQRELVLA